VPFPFSFLYMHDHDSMRGPYLHENVLAFCPPEEFWVDKFAIFLAICQMIHGHMQVGPGLNFFKLVITIKHIIAY